MLELTSPAPYKIFPRHPKDDLSFGDSVNGICYEHTTSEGIAVVAMLQKIITKMENEDRATMASEE